MATSFPPRTNTPPGIPVNLSARSYLRVLQAELDTEADTVRGAALLYEIASITELKLQEIDRSIELYQSAWTGNGQFRPSLQALMRLYEARRSYEHLERIFKEEARVAQNGEQQANSLVDLALLLIERQESVRESLELLEEALALDPNNRVAPLVLEHHYLVNRQSGLAEKIARMRVERIADLDLKTVLWWEIAAERERQGDHVSAIELLRRAAAETRESWRSLEIMERYARIHQIPEIIIDALQARAELTSKATGSELEPGSATSLLITRLGGMEQTIEYGAVLWREVARTRLALARDPWGAVSAYERAVAVAPTDLLLRYEQMEAFKAAGELTAYVQAARSLLEQRVSGPLKAVLYFGIAQAARVQGDQPEAVSALTSAVDADPNSAGALAALEEAWLENRSIAHLVNHLELRAATRQGQSRAAHLWRAGLLAAERLSDSPRASRLLREALAEWPAQLAIVRDLHGQALRFGDAATARQAAMALCRASEVDEAERCALYRERYQLERYVFKNLSDAEALLAEVSKDNCCKIWAPDAARLCAAAYQRFDRLAEAHLVLAARVAQDEIASAHFCAAARAWLFSGNEEAAHRALEDALARVPFNPYAIALLEEILLTRGATAELASLLRDSARSATSTRQAVYALLYAGMAAEKAGDLEIAQRCYEDAAERDPEALAPLCSLKKLGEKTSQLLVIAHALELLAAREAKIGAPSTAALRLGQYYELIGKPDLAVEPLKTTLYDQQVGLAAALSLTLLPYRLLTPFERDSAWARLGQMATGNFAQCVARIRAGVYFDQGRPQARRVLQQVCQDYPLDRWARLMSIGHAADAEERARAFIGLSQVTEDTPARLQLLLHGLRLYGYRHWSELGADGLPSAVDLVRMHAGRLLADIAADEGYTLFPATAERVAAQARRIESIDDPSRAELVKAAYLRDLYQAGCYSELCRQAEQWVTRDPADLAVWELLRVSARATGNWPLLAKACDTLAEHCQGVFFAALSEEAGAVYMNYLGRDDLAKLRLQSALALDPSRQLSFELLHQLLERGNESEHLLQLVSNHLTLVEDPSEKTRCLLEQARLQIELGDRADALTSLERIFELDPSHSAALILRAQVHVSLEQWPEAVEALIALGDRESGTETQFFSATGAAYLLERQLSNPGAAYLQLAILAHAQPVGREIFAKMASLAWLAGLHQEACEALTQAAALSDGQERARLEGYAGDIQKSVLDDRSAAAQAYRRALSVSPNYEPAVSALVELADTGERAERLADYERFVRRELESSPVDPKLLRQLLRFARLGAHRDLKYLVLNTLVSLKLADRDESAEVAQLTPSMPTRISGRLSEATFSALGAPDQKSNPARLVSRLSAAAVALEEISPGLYGATREQRIDASDTASPRQEVQELLDAFGLRIEEFFWGGNDSVRIAIIPKPGNVHIWIMGKEVKSPLSSAQRLTVVQLATTAYLQIAPFAVRRTIEQDLQWMRAIAFAAEAPFADSHAPADDGERNAAARYAKAISRKLRRELNSALVESGVNLEEISVYITAARRCLQRVGLLLVGDIQVALNDLLDFDSYQVQVSSEAMELIAFFVSPQHLALRREIGFGL
jgi:tetratricopeptide (TPR) repeat protein